MLPINSYPVIPVPQKCYECGHTEQQHSQYKDRMCKEANCFCVGFLQSPIDDYGENDWDDEEDEDEEEFHLDEDILSNENLDDL